MIENMDNRGLIKVNTIYNKICKNLINNYIIEQNENKRFSNLFIEFLIMNKTIKCDNKDFIIDRHCENLISLLR